MNLVRLASLSAFGLAVLAACGDEIPTTSDAPIIAVAPAAPAPAVDAGPLNVADGGALPGLPAPIEVTDAGPLADRVPPCMGAPEVEPNDDAAPIPLAAPLCGSLTAADVDAFQAKSQSKPTTLHFEADGDAELELRGFGARRTLRSGEELSVPSFPVALGFTVVVQSPTGRAQSYRITYE
jgi:hypothetical protein